MGSRPLGSPTSILYPWKLSSSQAGKGRELAAHATFTCWRITARPWSSPQQGMCCPSHLAKSLPPRSALPSHCASLQWEWSGHLVHSQNTVSAQENKNLTTAVQGYTKPGSVREASVRRNSAVPDGCWLHTVGLREWENQTPPGSTQVSRGNEPHTKVSRRQTGLRVSR